MHLFQYILFYLLLDVVPALSCRKYAQSAKPCVKKVHKKCTTVVTKLICSALCSLMMSASFDPKDAPKFAAVGEQMHDIKWNADGRTDGFSLL